MTDILERLSFNRVINATGTVTRLGASPIDPAVIDAMAAAARWSVDIAELQGRASDIISDCAGAEPGIVTSGAMAGLLVGTAACPAGLDPVKIARLPDTAGMRNEFIVSRSHRNSYDHGVRAAGGGSAGRGRPAGSAHRLRCARHRGVGIRERDRRAHGRHPLSRVR
jgi:L-seryl-tRNA(Ser) seleniumtransferase